jgi:hypothetical protein
MIFLNGDKHTICVWSRGIKVMILVRRVWRYQRVSVNRRRTDNTMNKRTNDDLQNITWIQFTSYRQKCQLVVRDELNLHPTIGGVYRIASFLKIIIPYYLYTKYNMKRCNKGSDRGNGHSCFQENIFRPQLLYAFICNVNVLPYVQRRAKGI